VTAGCIVILALLFLFLVMRGLDPRIHLFS
jgi:hypothetical protein